MGHFITPVLCGWWLVCTTWFVKQIGDVRLPQNANIQNKRCLYYALDEVEVECVFGIEWREQWEYPRHRHQKKQQGKCDETEISKRFVRFGTLVILMIVFHYFDFNLWWIRPYEELFPELSRFVVDTKKNEFAAMIRTIGVQNIKSPRIPIYIK